MTMMRGAITVRLCCPWCHKVSVATAPWQVCSLDTLDINKLLRDTDTVEHERSVTNYDVFGEVDEQP